MAFVPNRCFENLTGAFDFIMNQYALRPSERVWFETGSGLLVPEQVPQYLFRGECGEFETTKAGMSRPETYRVRGTSLSSADLKALEALIPDLARRFTLEEDYSLEGHHAIGLLQHYGLPTSMVDFSGHLGYAFAFAVACNSSVGRVAVVPSRALSEAGKLVDLSDHKWAERPRKQAAFAVMMTEEPKDLKSATASSQLNISWYQFPVADSDRAYLKSKYEELVRLSDDVTAGFLRFHITEYVEAFGKFSPELTDWLLARVPIAPRCYRVKGFDGEDVIVNHCAADVLTAFDSAAEAEYSQRYWSSAFPDDSADRIKGWTWPSEGSLVADPRTYHPNL